MFLVSVLLWTLLVISQGLAANVQGKEIYAPYINEGESEPSCAQGRNYCEHEDNYPKETIMKLLQRFDDAPRELTNLIFDDDLDESGHESGYGRNSENSLYFNNSLETRKNNQFCETKPERIRPVVAKNLQNEWLYIVNVDGYSQHIDTEVCKNENANCSTIRLSDRIAKCHQVRRKVELLALHPSGKKLQKCNNVVNGCCKCILYTPKDW